MVLDWEGGEEPFKQVHSTSSKQDDVQMLSQYMNLLNEITGAHGAMRGEQAKSGTPSSLYAQETHTANAKVCWGDNPANDSTVYSLYKTAYDNLSTYLIDTAGLNTAGDTTIDPDTFKQKFSDYYAASIELQNAIATRVAELEAQSAIDDMEVGGENLCGLATASISYVDPEYVTGSGYSAYYKCIDLGVQLEANKNYVASCGDYTEQVTKYDTGAVTTLTIPDEFAGSYLAVVAYDGACSYEYMAAFDWCEVINVPKHTNGWALRLFVVLGGKDITVRKRYYPTVAVPTVESKTANITVNGSKVQFTYKLGTTYVTPSAFSVSYTDSGTGYSFSKSLVATQNGSTSFEFTCGTTGTRKLQLQFPYNNATYGALFLFTTAFTSGSTYRVNIYYYAPTTRAGAYCIVRITQSTSIALTGDDARSLLIDELLNDTIDTGDIANLSAFCWGSTDSDGDNTDYYKHISEIQVQAGTRPTKFQAYTEHLTNALQGSTEVTGGLLMTNVLMLKNEKNKVTAGMSGLSGTSSNPENVLLWGGGDYYDAANAANSSTYAKKNGTPITTLIKKDGTGKIGIFKIGDTQAIVDVPNQGKVIIDAGTTNGGIFIRDYLGLDKVAVSPKNSDDISFNNSYTINANGNGTNTTFTKYSSYICKKQIITFADGGNGKNNIDITGNFTFVLSMDPYGIQATDNHQVQISIVINLEDKDVRFDVIKTDTFKSTDTDVASAIYNQTSFVRTYSVANYTHNSNITGIIKGVSIQAELLNSYKNEEAQPTCTFDSSCKTTYSVFAQSEITLTENPHIIIARDGIISYYDSSTYFKIRNTSSGQQIFACGLPTSTANLTKGQLYNSGGALKIKQ